jgi:uncharacterized Zn finger protein (UPF0148 family)
METKTLKTCPECGEPLIGRTDKKFCSDLCRNAHNNIQQSHTNKKLSTTNSILKKNRQILERLIEQRAWKVSKDKLLQQGFSFYYVTSLHYDLEKSFCFYCYEYGYYAMEGNCYKLMRLKKG